MARSGRLKKPELTSGAHRALNDALHQLHALARYPSLQSLQGVLAENRVPYASRSTVHNAFCSTRLPKWELVDALAVAMAGMVRNTSSEKIDQASIVFDNLWFIADLEDRRRHDRTGQMADASAEAARTQDPADARPALMPGTATGLEPLTAEVRQGKVRLRTLRWLSSFNPDAWEALAIGVRLAAVKYLAG